MSSEIGNFTKFKVPYNFKIKRPKNIQMMEEVTMSVNESQRKAIAMKAIKDLEDACDSWEKSGVSCNVQTLKVLKTEM